MILAPRDVEIRHAHIFCGLGGGARGFNRGAARVGHLRARLRCIGGIDRDAAAVRDFERLAGVRGTVLDLFDRAQYRAFHGCEPPDDWREATPRDIRRAFNYEHPHMLFLSAPCKGFSGLLSEKSSRAPKYQALNGLTLRGVWLALEAFKDDPIELIAFENVPRIKNRGRHLIDQILALYRAYGYAAAESEHDCGELGGLGQHRMRFLLMARHVEKVPPFLYQPPKRTVRGVGEIIGRLPVPGPDPVLPMHRLPMLQWQTWVRLAFVEAGSDWRSLNRLNVADGVLRDFRLQPDRQWNNGVLGVRGWADAANTVTGNSRPGSGSHAVADPRIDGHERSVQCGVREWHEPASVVTGKMHVGQGPHAAADPRYGDWHPGASSSKLRVTPWDESSRTITGAGHVASGALSVADPRLSGAPRFNHVYRIVPWGEPAPAIAGGGGPAGGLSVADPRTGFGPATHNNILRVTDWDSPARTVTSGAHPSGGGLCVSDPRPHDWDPSRGALGVVPWQDPTGTIIGVRAPGQGYFSVADPRPQFSRDGRDVYTTAGQYGVIPWESPSGAVTGAGQHDSGRWSVADPRPQFSRDGRDVYTTAGQYGVIPWESPSGAVTGAGQHDSGRWSVADPREPYADAGAVSSGQLPAPTDHLVALICALDGTYHRPFTTLELAALQSLVDPDEVLELHGQSDAAWRERIGNAVPPDAAEAMASVMATTLLLAWSGETFMLSATPIWVRPLAVALSVKPNEATA